MPKWDALVSATNAGNVTSGADWTDVCEVPLTMPVGNVTIEGSWIATAGALAAGSFRLMVDGVAQAPVAPAPPGEHNGGLKISYTVATGGAHTFKLQCLRGALSTLTIDAGEGRIEVRRVPNWP